MKLVFRKIKRQNIFCDDYNDLTQNNIIEFTNNNISILYGSNGTGKTSLAMVLNQEKESQYSIQIDNINYTESDKKIIHLIEDQNGRNIIAGNTDDFILGDNIKRENELKKQLEKGFNDLYNFLINELKTTFGISTKSSPFEKFITNKSVVNYINDLANKNQKGKNIDREEFLNTINSMKIIKIPNYDEVKLKYFIDDVKKLKDSIILNFIAQEFNNIKQEPHLVKIEETDDAVKILEKYNYLTDCIVCDSEIERDLLLEKKKAQNKAAIESLSNESKIIIEKIIEKIDNIDPFEIKSKLKSALISGNNKELLNIISDINQYKIIYEALLVNFFVDSIQKSNLTDVFNEYKKIIIEKPEFEDEDVIFIENFLNECLDRKIRLDRDKENNLKLLLGDQEFLNEDRHNLSLSNGEQNFLSLSFELLKAKKSTEDIVVLDDPISSFDSIFKNKIAYAIIKFLNLKKSIVLTHNTDLIKLLEHQHQNCFNLYYINNTDGENNGFIFINQNEVKILLYIHEFLNLLRQNIINEIIDEKSFLISLIPFMRGYSQITNNINIKNQLTKLMHGYENEVINVTQIYKQLFSNNIINNDYNISAQDIINSDIENVKIIKSDTYPLLSKTLYHTYVYLYLRLNVEKKLVDKYSIDTKKNEMLGNILSSAFNNKSKEDIKKRVFFLSRKTLLNEFNHFEMEMNIFQPAIDITNQVLKKEKNDIMKKLNEI